MEFIFLTQSVTCILYEVKSLVFIDHFCIWFRNLRGSSNCRHTPASVFLNATNLLLAPNHLILELVCLFSCSCLLYCETSWNQWSDCFSYWHSEEHIGLDDNKYIGDLLAEFKAAKDRAKGEILHCKLIFKKKLFRESDEAVTDPMFVQLSYVQVILFIMKSYLELDPLLSDQR